MKLGRSYLLLTLGALILAPLAADAAPAPVAKKPAKSVSPPPPPGGPRPMDPLSMRFRPPAGAPKAGAAGPKKNPDVPQAKTLSETPDVVLNSRVRASLIAARIPKAQDILAETAKGVVTLSGSVPSAALRAKAERTAKKIRGVKGVKNQIKVKK